MRGQVGNGQMPHLISPQATETRPTISGQVKQCHGKSRPKGIAKSYPFEKLTIAKILAQDRRHPRQLGRGPDEAVPIRELMLPDATDGFDDHPRRTLVDEPGTHVVRDAPLGFCEGQWRFNLAGDRDKEFAPG